jgi:hypothetical protein
VLEVVMVQVFSQRLSWLARSSSIRGSIDGALAVAAVSCVGFGLAAVLGILR